MNQNRASSGKRRGKTEGNLEEPQNTIAVLLMAYGGLDTLDNLEAYLQNVLGGRKPAPEMLQEMRRRYALIGGKSPLLDNTLAQAAALEKQLNEVRNDAIEYCTFVGMRHWHPTIDETLEQIAARRIHEIVAICMAPHYSDASIGAYRRKLQSAQTALGAEGEELTIHFIESWHDQSSLIEAHTRHIEEQLCQHKDETKDRVMLLFTAHSLPLSRMRADDPYPVQFRETASLIADKLGLPDEQWKICYQSVPHGATGWLGPHLEEAIHQAAETGCRNILVVPIGFVTDHIETLYDVDIEARNLAGEYGIHLERAASMNTAPQFIDCLSGIVLGATRETTQSNK